MTELGEAADAPILDWLIWCSGIKADGHFLNFSTSSEAHEILNRAVTGINQLIFLFRSPAVL